jgi:hypothetical protein
MEIHTVSPLPEPPRYFLAMANGAGVDAKGFVSVTRGKQHGATDSKEMRDKLSLLFSDEVAKHVGG